LGLKAQGSPNSHGARPVHLIITMTLWIRTSRLSIKNSLSHRVVRGSPGAFRHVLRRNVKRFRGGLVFKAHELVCKAQRLLYHSTLASRVIKKKEEGSPCGVWQPRSFSASALEATQGQNDSFLSQRPYKCYLEEVAFLGD